MGFMTIDGRRVKFTDEPNILSVIRKAGIDIPTLCYHSELSVYGACRLCTCERQDLLQLFRKTRGRAGDLHQHPAPYQLPPHDLRTDAGQP